MFFSFRGLFESPLSNERSGENSFTPLRKLTSVEESPFQRPPALTASRSAVVAEGRGAAAIVVVAVVVAKVLPLPPPATLPPPRSVAACTRVLMTSRG
jgi:hypothetical protein